MHRDILLNAELERKFRYFLSPHHNQFHCEQQLNFSDTSDSNSTGKNMHILLIDSFERLFKSKRLFAKKSNQTRFAFSQLK